MAIVSTNTLNLGPAFLAIVPANAYSRLECEDTLAMARHDPMRILGSRTGHVQNPCSEYRPISLTINLDLSWLFV